MDKVKIIVINLLTVFFAVAGIAQNPDENQMDQDIEIVEGILGQMFFQNYESSFQRKQVNGNYLSGFGLVFKIPRYANYFLGQNISSRFYELIDDENSSLAIGKNVFMKSKKDSIVRAANNQFNETIKSFFVNYGDLIDQLHENDNILVIFGSESHQEIPNVTNNPFVIRQLKREDVNEVRPDSKITAQVSYKDILDYKRGKSSESQFIKKIKFSERKINKNLNQEFVILAGIFEKYYHSSSGSFNYKSQIGFERIDELGVIYEMSVDHNWFLVGPKPPILELNAVSDSVKERTNLKLVNRNVQKFNRQKMEEFKGLQNKAYKEFKLKLKQNLIKYGKTLKSLKDDQILMIAAKFPNCLSCDRPGKLNLIVKASVLRNYDQRKITLDQAVEKIMEKEVKNQ